MEPREIMNEEANDQRLGEMGLLELCTDRPQMKMKVGQKFTEKNGPVMVFYGLFGPYWSHFSS